MHYAWEDESKLDSQIEQEFRVAEGLWNNHLEDKRYSEYINEFEKQGLEREGIILKEYK